MVARGLLGGEVSTSEETADTGNTGTGEIVYPQLYSI